MSAATILVIGSANMDMIVQSERLPRPGETVIGGTFSMVPGGKGANQAVAAGRLGGRAAFAACLGDDDFGRSLCRTYERDGVDTRAVQLIPDTHTGVAFILVDSHGENLISVASGANARFTPERLGVLDSLDLAPQWVLLQLEIPLETVAAAARWARQRGASVILDPAPAPCGGLPDSLLSLVDILTPNEVEAAALTGLRVDSPESALEAGRLLVARGAKTALVKLGERGGVCVAASESWQYSTPSVKAVDTTAAGDCFAGALAVALSEGQTLRNAVGFAARAAALSVTRVGAQSSLPQRADLCAQPPETA
ncbi:MAG: ribokinase [Candidatus Sumerlaeia bacterium]|nr:ribokinase [Candidatus Sumerlaeia bacterium]